MFTPGGVLHPGASAVYEGVNTFNIIPRDRFGNLLDKDAAEATFEVSYVTRRRVALSSLANQ